MSRKSATRKMREFEIHLRKLKKLYAEKKEILRQKYPQEFQKIRKIYTEFEKRGYKSGQDNQLLHGWIKWLEHLNPTSELEFTHEEVVDKVSKWFAEKGYAISKEEPFIVDGMDFIADIFLYKPRNFGGVECKPSKCDFQEIQRGLGQVLIYRESFNFAYLASSSRMFLSEIIKKLAKRCGFGIIFVGDDVEEVVKPIRNPTAKARFARSSFEQKWRPENQRKVIAVMRDRNKVKKRDLRKLVAEIYGTPIHEVSNAISELRIEGILGIEDDNYVLFL